MRIVHVALPDPFPAGARKLTFIEGLQIMLFNLDGVLVAIENSCPHAGASLHAAKLQGRWLSCPSHGWRFDLGCPAATGPDVLRYPVEFEPGGARLSLPGLKV